MCRIVCGGATFTVARLEDASMARATARVARLEDASLAGATARVAATQKEEKQKTRKAEAFRVIAAISIRYT